MTSGTYPMSYSVTVATVRNSWYQILENI